jgi:two-component system, chemotaxis family, response regulator Rcp1
MTSFNIVLAEDNPADVYLIRQALSEHEVSCHVCVVRDGKSAIRFFSGPMEESFGSRRPDLILLDLNLPQHDGIEILKAIRASRELAQVPVAILSSSESPRDRCAVDELGVVRYIRKPLELDEFMSLGKTIKDILPGTSPPDAGPHPVQIYEWPAKHVGE